MTGVCIKYFHENYGGMLQAYATTQILEERGIEYELIRYEKKKSICFVLKSIPRVFNRILLNDKIEAYKKKRGLKKHPEFKEKEKVRKKAFERFAKLYFTRFSKVYTGYKALCKAAEKYDAVLTGSDQLWSPAGLPTNFYNLMFVPENIRKISYASSFGVKKIPWYQKYRTKRFLNRIEFISMREIQGSEIVKKLTGRKVQVILDPVFMFDKRDWERLIPAKKIIAKPYIFVYFLGRNQKHRAEVTKFAKNAGIKIAALKHLDQYVDKDEGFGDYELYDIGPDDFLNLLRGAEYICTDSFHCACFSIIHQKQFVVFDRYDENAKYSKNSRIDTLCENFGIWQQRYKEDISVIYNKIDYDRVNQKLRNLKLQAETYLDNAFEKG